ncbi:MAG: gliding motility protein GldN [Flavobacteriaceae bacterium]
MKNVIFIVLILAIIGSNKISAQSNLLNAKVPQEVGINFEQSSANETKPVQYGYVDDRDILWSKTIWEIIDLDERINFPYYYPSVNNGYLSSDRQSLFRVLMDNIQQGNITEIYETDYFNEKLTFEELKVKLEDRKITEEARQKLNSGIITEDQLTDDDYDVYIIDSFKVIQYFIKGTWYFNKRLGELRYRLLGIAPGAQDVSTLSESSEDPDILPLFWVWFPDARETLNKHRVFNTKNSSKSITFDMMLNSRHFNSSIYKEENVYEDREVKEYIYEDALRQLIESERIKSVIRDFEQDMWNN